MKTKAIFYLLTLSIFFQTSCNSPKNITMLQDLQKQNKVSNSLNPPKKHVIRIYDNLYVNILTLDQNVNMLFNPNMGGNSSNGNTQYMYGTPAGQYINGYQVNEQGLITIPIIGEVKVINLTIDEVEKRIKTKAEEYLKEPSVKVKLLNYKIDILGEVNAPGPNYNYEGTINILEAISLARGITLYADLKNVVVNRKINNKVQSYKVDLTNSDIYNSEVYYLQPNDVVYVPPTKLKRRNVNNSTISIILSTVTTIIAVVAYLK